jgi:carboxypeptidase family protein
MTESIMKVISIIGATLAVTLSSLTMLHAQAVGEILGTVRDPSGAIVAGAKVSATEVATGFSRVAETNSSGEYSLFQLPTGTYNVIVTAVGFESATSNSIDLHVNQQQQLDFNLRLGGTTQRVEVVATAPAMNTTNGGLGGLVTGGQVQALPLNGRSIANLVMLQPGINQEQSQTGWLAPEWAGNGNRGQTQTGTLDGLDISDAEMGNLEFWDFNLDAIAEFKVLQNNYSAQYGQGAGTMVLMVSKSGANLVHGSGFEFIRNNILDARNYFAAKVPPFERNEFGGTIGGPIKKDQTFFFGQYAGLSQRLGEPSIIPVPTDAERQGIVTITGSNGQPETLQVPLNSVAQQALARYPEPNQPSGQFGANTFNDEFKIPSRNDQFSVRVDHTFSPKDSLFVRASYINHQIRSDDPLVAVEAPDFGPTLTNNARNDGVSETHVFSPTLLNTASFTVNRILTGQVPGTITIPQSIFTDGSLATFGPDTFYGFYTVTQFIPQDNLTWVKGRHTLNIGGMFRRLRDNAIGASLGGPNGTFLFTPGQPVAVAIPTLGGGVGLAEGSPSPNSLITFMLGQPSDYNRAVPMPGFGPPGGGYSPYAFRAWHINSWIQDDIKLTKSLTVNLGFRYEYNSVPVAVNHQAAAIVDQPSFGNGALWGQLVIDPNPLYHPDHRGFAPRFGFAQRLGRKTTLRGGFGTFTNSPPNVFPDAAGNSFPFAAFSTELNPPFSLTPLQLAGAPPVLSLSGDVMPPHNDTRAIPPNTPINLAAAAQYLLGPILGNLTSVTFKNGYTMSGNLTVEHQLADDLTLQVAYVANNAVGLYAPEYPNAYTGAESQYTPYSNVNPGLGEFMLLDNHAHSTYNGLQAQFRKLSRRGYQFQATYAWAKTIDNASTLFNANIIPNGGNLQQNPYCWQCEKSDAAFDIRQRFVLNINYELPLAKVHSLPRRLAEGWQGLAIVTEQTGFPFTVTSPYGTVAYGTDTYEGFQATRPDLIQKPALRGSGSPEEQFFSNDVVNNQANYFATPTTTVNGATLQTRPGNLGRNTFRTDPVSNVDFSLIKDTNLTERTKIQFRAEIFNLFNFHSFGFPVQVLGAPGFGTSTSTPTGFPERQAQLALRLIF